ncbi:Rubisco accumulation factor 1.2, chloroplastic [Linum grandiflorum]
MILSASANLAVIKPYNNSISFNVKNYPFFTHHPRSSSLLPPPKTSQKPVSPSFIPANPPPVIQPYQPFRPPQSPLPPQYRSLDPAERLEILANRNGLWYEYAPLITFLIRDGFSPSSIEESTGISGVEQNRLVVGAQVRESLIEAKTDPALISHFETSGAELLYELRLLSVSQRAAAARFIIENRFDSRGAGDLARSMKDFPRRKGEKNWEDFDYSLPGDCLSFLYFRQAKENKNPSDARTSGLEMALEVAESEKAKAVVLLEIEGGGDSTGSKEEDGEIDATRVPVVRMKIGEVGEAPSVKLLPVCRSEDEITEAPWELSSEGAFGTVAAEKGWRRWVVLPGWSPVAGLGNGGVAVSFGDARALPWRVNRWYKEEAILVVVDRNRKGVEVDDGFYLVAVSGGLKVERGSALKLRGVEGSLGTVVLVVRPPKEDNEDQQTEEDWE